MKYLWLAIILLLFSLFSLGCSDNVDEMKSHKIGILNLSTVIGETWIEVNSPDFGTDMALFAVDEDAEISVTKSVTFGGSDNYLEQIYNENHTYDEFISDFIERFEEKTENNYERIDKVNKQYPIFATTSDYSVQAFSIIETSDRPILIGFMLRDLEPNLELIKEHDSYDHFIEMIKNTKALH